MRRTLVAGIGYRHLRDYSSGGAIADRLAARRWPPHVAVEDISYNPIAFAQRLEDEPPGRRFERLVVASGVARPGRTPGTITVYRWDGTLPPPDAVQAAVAEGLTGVISLDNTLVVARHLAVLPPEVVVVEIQPGLHEFGDTFTPAVAAAVDRACALVAALALDEAAAARVPLAPLGGLVAVAS
ncbi:MAG TPA: hydrogenase maturation protease [Vicinamibacterales bacterium]|nr:hydrogenase maturation protease [Vicinamibacterales bacterium]